MENDMNDVFSWDEEDGGAITLFDDDGNESSFNVLSSKEQDGSLYLLVAEAQETEDDIIEVMHFKCISNDGDEMAFELVDEEHPDFALVMELFKDDYETMEIDIVSDTEDETAIDSDDDQA